MKTNLTYFKRLIDGNDPASVKRFLGLVWSAFMMVASIVILFVKVPLANQNLMHDILLYGFAIVFVSLLGVTLESFATMVVKKAEAISHSMPSTIIQNAESVTGGTKVDTVNTDNIETVNSQNTNVNASQNTSSTPEPEDKPPSKGSEWT